MPNVAPQRFSDKTADESKLYAIDWANALAGDSIDETPPNEPVWTSEPPGLAFSDANVTGTIAQVRISGGREGTSYRVRHRITTTSTNETLEAFVGNVVGIPLQVADRSVYTGPSLGWANRVSY